MTAGTALATAMKPDLTGKYVVDPAHSRVGFVARHAMVSKVRGSFNEFEGSGYLDAADPTGSSLELAIKAASIDTRSPDRDAHLRSNDFFDMEKYPEIKFVSTAVDQVDPTDYLVTGDLTIKGATRPVTFQVIYHGDAVDPYGNRRIGLEGKTTVNRKDWGVNWNAALEAGGVLVSENVTIDFEVSAIQVAEPS